MLTPKFEPKIAQFDKPSRHYTFYIMKQILLLYSLFHFTL